MSQIPRTILRPKKAISSPRIENNTMEDNIIKNINNLLKLKKENNALKDRIIRYIRALFESERED